MWRAHHHSNADRGMFKFKTSNTSPISWRWDWSPNSWAFLVRAPIKALPDAESPVCLISSLQHWHLCQALVRHLRQRWSTDYLDNLQKLSRCHVLSRNLHMCDIVCLRKEPIAPTKWPLARIIEVHSGKDGKVQVVTVKTMKGMYKRPIVKVVPLMHQSWLKPFGLAGSMLSQEKKWRERPIF